MKVYLVIDDLEHVLSIHKTKGGAESASAGFFYAEAHIDSYVTEWEVSD